MLFKSSFQLINHTKSQTLNAFQKVAQLLKKKYLAALVLGTVGNLLVTVFFNWKYQRNIWSINIEEYYLAIAISLILLSINQGLTGILKTRIRKRPIKWKVIYLVSSTLSLNTLVISITYGFYQSF